MPKSTGIETKLGSMRLSVEALDNIEEYEVKTGKHRSKAAFINWLLAVYFRGEPIKWVKPQSVDIDNP